MPALTVFQMRRGTAAQWNTQNPILGAAEPGYETDTGDFKLGDGLLSWSALPYVGADKALAGHTHLASQISDSTATGRSVLTAASAAVARSAIGAGTSDLALGSTAGTAKAGNWVPSFAEVTGVLGTNQLPPLAINQPSPVASQAAMLALVAQRGDVAIRTDIGKTFILSTDSPGTLADWLELIGTSDVVSVSGKTGAVTLNKTDVGLSEVDNTSDADKPISSLTATALAGKEAAFAAGTAAQYRRGDKIWATLDKAAVGLSAVDNTSDANKPVSSATNTALGAKAPLASPTFTGTVTLPATTNGLTKSNVGLSSVDNTADSAKPVSSAQQTALNLKANTASPTFTGTVVLPSTTNGLSKSNVGLTNVDNTSDAAKPISTATATALAGKAPTSHTHTTNDITTIDGGTP